MAKRANASPSFHNRRILLGTAIRRLRKQANMSQRELAQAIGKSVPTVSKIELGDHPMDIDLLTLIASALDTTTSGLLWESQRPRLETDPQLRDIVPVMDRLLQDLNGRGIDF